MFTNYQLSNLLPITPRKYYVIAISLLLFVLLFSQKSNFLLSFAAVCVTLIGFYFLLHQREKNYYAYAAEESLHDESSSVKNDAAYATFDKHFNISYVSPEFTDMLGIEEGNLLTILRNCAIKESDIEKMKNAIKNNCAFNDMLEIKIINESFYIDTFIYKTANKNITKSEYIIRCNDITSYISTKEELKNQLFLDRFTKLPTRLQLTDDLAKIATQKSFYAQTLLYIQVDNYEEINEFFGIDVGHKLLLDIAKWLAENKPTASTELYKFDHNNFAMFDASRINLSDLEHYLKTLSNKIAHEHFIFDDTHHDVTFTIGVSRGKKNLLKHAYIALKEAQKKHKSYIVFNKKNTQEEKYLQNIQTNKLIKKALNEDRIIPFFQPILNIQTNEVEKFESLMRIQNENNTHLRPADFLHIAKQSKLYPRLTKAMITASLKRLEFLQYPITINISIDDILNVKVSNFILNQLKKHPFAHLITFEILETDEISSYTRVANFIKKIKALQCTVAIDDFGSGYSNFEQVLKLDIDYIKIDGSLIKDIDINKESEIITKTIINFAKELNIKTIAEFVSTEAIFDKVKTLGVDYAQGYFIGKPAPLSAHKEFNQVSIA